MDAGSGLDTGGADAIAESRPDVAGIDVRADAIPDVAPDAAGCRSNHDAIPPSNSAGSRAAPRTRAAPARHAPARTTRGLARRPAIGLRLRRKHVFVRLPRQRGRREHRVTRACPLPDAGGAPCATNDECAAMGRYYCNRTACGDANGTCQPRPEYVACQVGRRTRCAAAIASTMRARAGPPPSARRSRSTAAAAVARRAVSGRPQAGVASSPRSAAAGSAARMKRLADQDRVDAGGAQPRDVGGVPDARLGDHDAVGRDGGPQARGQLVIDVERAQVAVVDADDARRRRRQRARTSASSCASTSASRPERRRGRAAGQLASSSAATISRMASAPAARASSTWYESTMKSLRSTGTPPAARAGRRSSSAPPKNGLVGQHRQRAGARPPRRRAPTARVDAFALIQPPTATRRLNSAMQRDRRRGRRSAAQKLRASPRPRPGLARAAPAGAPLARCHVGARARQDVVQDHDAAAVRGAIAAQAARARPARRRRRIGRRASGAAPSDRAPRR